MSLYRMQGADTEDAEFEMLLATHPAPPGTFIVYAFADGSSSKVAVVLWGVLQDGTAVPITLGGVWDGVSNQNNFVLHPDGSCSTFEESWDSIEDALAQMREYDGRRSTLTDLDPSPPPP